MSTFTAAAHSEAYGMADPEKIARIQDVFTGIGVAQIHDAMPDQVQILDRALQLRTPRFKLAGPVFPVETHDDILPGLQAIENAPRGAALYFFDSCLDGAAITGDIVLTAVKEHGLAGLIVDGTVRDIEFIQDIGVALFSRSVSPISAKTESAATALPATVQLRDGTTLTPGDWVFGDLDGIALVSHAIVEDVVTSAKAIFDRESEVKAELRSGVRLATLTGAEQFVTEGTPMKFRP